MRRPDRDYQWLDDDKNEQARGMIDHWIIQNRILSNFKVAIHLFEAASNKVVLNVLKSSLERQQCFSVGVF